MVRARHAVLLRNIIRSHGWLILIVALIAQGIRATPANWTTDYPAEATVGQYIQHEIDSGILGTTAANEFLPADVKTIPPPTGFVIDSLAGGGLAQRINTWTYPDGVQFETLESSPTQYKFRVSSPDPVLAEVYLFKYPGWEATLDGDLVEMHLTGDFGFFGIYVPAGEHVVEIRYPLTTPQQAGLLLSGLSIVLIGGWLWMQRRGMDSAHCSSQKTGAYVDAPLHSHNRLRFVGADRRFRPLIIAYIIVLIGIVLLMREGVAWTASPPGEARLAADAYPVDFDGAVQLLGYQVVKAPADRVWRVSLYWFFDAELAEDESINAYVHLVDGAGQIIAQSDKFAINHITQRAGWRAEMHLRDTYHLFLPEDLPDGEYQLRVGLWRCLEGTPLDCTNRQSLPAMVGGVPVSEANVELH